MTVAFQQRKRWRNHTGNQSIDRWPAVHDDVNATGVFDSPFSKRVGISRG